MPYTEEQMKEFDRKMFGCDIDVFERSVIDSVTFKTSGIGRVVMSMLSDVQELVDFNAGKDCIRQEINKVKYLVDKYVCVE